MAELLVLWDVDYTLVNAAGLGTRLYEVVFREMFGRELPGVAPKAGRTDRAIARDTLELAGIAAPAAQVDGFLAALGRLAGSDGTGQDGTGQDGTGQDGTGQDGTGQDGTGQDGTRPAGVRPARVVAMPGAAAAIAALEAAGEVRQSVLTGNIRPLAALKLRLAGLGEHLDLDAGAYGDVHEVRAELVPAAWRAARGAFGADFAGPSTVLVGDTPLDVEAALATGARVVGVATGSYQLDDLRRAGAHAVLPDLNDTARAVAAVTGSSG